MVRRKMYMKDKFFLKKSLMLRTRFKNYYGKKFMIVFILIFIFKNTIVRHFNGFVNFV